jgi:hypothetical protein
VVEVYATPEDYLTEGQHIFVAIAFNNFELQGFLQEINDGGTGTTTEYGW